MKAKDVKMGNVVHNPDLLALCVRLRDELWGQQTGFDAFFDTSLCQLLKEAEAVLGPVAKEGE